MTLFQVFSIGAFSILIGVIIFCLYQKLWPKLKVATKVLFACLVFFGLIFYFGVVGNFVDDRLENRYQFWISKISYQGMYYCLILFIVSGILAFIIMIFEEVEKKWKPK